MAARNMYKIDINIHEKELCVRVVIYKDYTEMLHGQQNIKWYDGIIHRPPFLQDLPVTLPHLSLTSFLNHFAPKRRQQCTVPGFVAAQ